MELELELELHQAWEWAHRAWDDEPNERDPDDGRQAWKKKTSNQRRKKQN